MISEYSGKSTRETLYKIVSSKQQCKAARMYMDTQHSVRIHGDKNICQFITRKGGLRPTYWKKGYQHRFAFSAVCTYAIDKSETFFSSKRNMSWDILHC